MLHIDLNSKVGRIAKIENINTLRHVIQSLELSCHNYICSNSFLWSIYSVFCIIVNVNGIAKFEDCVNTHNIHVIHINGVEKTSKIGIETK